MNRRRFIAGTGGIATLGGLYAISRPGTASGDVETGMFTVEDHEVDATEGKLEHLWITNIQLLTAYEGFDYPAESVEWELGVVKGNETETYSTSTDLDGESFTGTVGAELDDIDLVDVFGADAFDVDGSEEGDAHEDFDVTFNLASVVHDAQGNGFDANASGSSTIGITDMVEHVETGGSADVEDDVGFTPAELSLDADSPGLADNDRNKAGRDRLGGDPGPYIGHQIDGTELTLEFVNPTDRTFSFDYRIDGRDGEADEWTGDEISGGPYAGEEFGPRYNVVTLDAGESASVTVQAREGVETFLQRGAEQDWYIRPIEFTGE